MYGRGTEYEAKFLEIDPKAMHKKLLENGAKLVHKRIKMIRSAFALCDPKTKGYARIRQEYNKITMTIKTYANPKFPEETEINVNCSFEDGEKFLLALGLKKKAFQESYRTTYILPNNHNVHEIVIDDLPGLPTYMEIDCKTEKALNNMIKLLKLDTSKMRYGPFGNTYNEYYDIPIDVINHTPFLTFGNIAKEIKPNKNKKLLKDIAKVQKDW